MEIMPKALPETEPFQESLSLPLPFSNAKQVDIWLISILRRRVPSSQSFGLYDKSRPGERDSRTKQRV